MKSADHRDELLHVMRKAVRRDHVRTEVVDLTGLGILGRSQTSWKNKYRVGAAYGARLHCLSNILAKCYDHGKIVKVQCESHVRDERVYG